MSWMQIPLSAVPFQTVSAVVNGQNYRVTVRQNGAFIYTSVMVDGVRVVDNALAVARGRVIPFAQTVARTRLYWVDTQGNDRPQYDGLGDRWILVYEAANE